MREARGWTQAELGAKVMLSAGRIAQFERAEGVPPKDIAKLLDEVLDSGGVFTEMRPFLQRSAYVKRIEALSDLESDALKIQQYALLIPGLFQTREYATALLSAGIPLYGGDLDEKVALRMGRQAVLDSPKRPWVRAIIDESALYKVIGDTEVMRRQLSHLLEMCERPRVGAQVLPRDGSSLVVTSLAQAVIWMFEGGRTVVAQETAADGLLIAEPAQVPLITSIYDQLAADSLSADASITLIRKVLEEQYS
ncbi:helix-turn-helix transcriptional regulator [Streptomyces sp. AV19]|uniref:helix-turn-helix domain-containing protein n=1 Tax=Streptomyces sp. AV19 TaxID=2793068 RepID=UPI0018FE3AC5|nr:helix-turn-helix transcriptional regulator [Streptomyces sp. AV19]MBH1938541.1 helix-turn-helix transcriptional regulator [Streptomyces sp. AV19]MDG4535190.1 helix-turn-helix transcriptional regulator [Streptomyces sp. AV19]